MPLTKIIQKAAIKGWLGRSIKEKETLRRLKLGRKVIEERIDWLRLHDTYTKDHCEKVTQYALKFAKDWGLSPVVQEQWYIAGLLHDIGKLLIPREIINSNTKLTFEQREIINLHTLFGELLFRGPQFLEQNPELKKNLTIINQNIPGIFELRPELEDVLLLDGLDHHEKLNGTGYPKKKTADQISTLARIIAVADIYDALTSFRSYRNPETSQNALKILEDGAAKGDYDPIIVTKFKEWITGIEATLKGYVGRGTLSLETVVNDRVITAQEILRAKNKHYTREEPLRVLNVNDKSRLLSAVFDEMKKQYTMVDDDSLRAIVYHAARYAHQDDITTKDITLSMDELRRRVEESKRKAAEAGRHHVEIVLDITQLKLDELAHRSIVVYQGRLCDKIIVSNRDPSRIALIYYVE